MVTVIKDSKIGPLIEIEPPLKETSNIAAVNSFF